MTPTRLRIVGREYDVMKLAEYTGQVGGVEFDTNTIKLKDGQQKLHEADTLLHESIHVIDDIFQLKMSERQVYCLAGGIIALLRDNPQLIEYFKSAIENPRHYE